MCEFLLFQFKEDLSARMEMYEFLLLGDKAGLDYCSNKLSKEEFLLRKKLNSEFGKIFSNSILIVRCE